ncbi:MAG: hypothetical protein CMF38_01830 [Legionellaceae bacterium]|nr:hypothetical protein [Legionellaceae bacterium]HAF87386.1 hypothetical protein [Legionellales bacterium]HCA88967.1 hypothetical protein [Legionellales bacterium]|tara:strand:+ start:113 stop:1366 length:1254 start_codon:yes stop_codon:yes gene_type:complete
MPKIYLIDRDGVLLQTKEGKKEIINPHFTIPFIRALIATQTPWAIITSSPDDGYIANDAFIKLMPESETIFDGKNTPAYPFVGQSNDNVIRDLTPDAFDDTVKFTFDLGEHNNEHVKAHLIKQALLLGTINEENNSILYQLEEPKISVTINFSSESTFKLKLSNSHLQGDDNHFYQSSITFNLLNWFNNKQLHNDGRQKLLQSLMALELLGHAPEITDGLRALGIEGIEHPEEQTYTTINLSDVVVIDDTPQVIELMNKAGVKAIRANTPCGDRTEEEKNQTNYVTNTYMNQISEIFPEELQREFSSLKKALQPASKVSLLELASIAVVEAMGLALIAAGALALAVSFGAAITLPAIVMTLPLLPIGIAAVAIGVTYMALPPVVVAASKVKDAFFTSKSAEKLDESTSLVPEGRPQN